MRVVVIGAGGHGKVVADAALAAGLSVLGFVDDRVCGEILGLPVASCVAGLEALSANTSGTSELGFIVAIGDNDTRKRLFETYSAQGLCPQSIIHPAAAVSCSARIGAGTYIGAEAVVNPQAQVGVDVIINTRASVEHDCIVGDHAFVAPHALMCGGSHVGEGALLGASATVGVGLSVGDWSRVGEGAVVKRDLPARIIAVGVPAHVVNPSI